MRTYRLASTTALFITLVWMSIGCSRRPTTDETITKDIEAKVATDAETKNSDVKVATSNGKVTLSGKVKSPAARQKVEQFAREEPGTAGLDDLISIQPDETQAEGQSAKSASLLRPSPSQLPPAVEKPKPQPIIVPTGTALTVRVGQALGSKTSQAGQTFPATLAQPVSLGERTAIPAGSTVYGTVVSAKSQGKIKGEGELTLALTSITVRGQTYSIQTSGLTSTAKGKGKRTAVTTGGGAAGGALIGGLAGGGKGAAIGALLGGGAGLAGGALTGNKQVEIPAESALSFRLSAPLTLPPPASE